MSPLGHRSRIVYRTEYGLVPVDQGDSGGFLTLISQETDLRGLSLSNLRSSTPRMALYSVSPVDFPRASHNAALLRPASSARLLVPKFSWAFSRAALPKPCRS